MLSSHGERGNQAEQNNIQPGCTVSSSSLSSNQAFYSLVHDDPSGEIIIVNAQFYPKSCTGWSFLESAGFYSYAKMSIVPGS